jgi:hypothetical protein
MTLEMQIRSEIYLAMESLGAPPRLLAVIGSWGDTLSDEAVAALLKEWNEQRSSGNTYTN